MATPTFQLVRASIADAKAIGDLVNTFARRGEMLPRTMAEVYGNLRDFYVVHDERGEMVARRVVGVGAMRQGESRSFALRVEVMVPEKSALTAVS